MNSFPRATPMLFSRCRTCSPHWPCRTRRSSTVCCSAPAPKPCLISPAISSTSALISVSSACYTPRSDDQIGDALRALREIGPLGRPANSQVTRLLCSDKFSLDAQLALYKINSIDGSALALELRTNPGCAGKTAHIVEALKNGHSETAVAGLAQLLLAQEEKVAGTTIRILRSLGSQVSAAVPILLAALDDSDRGKQRAAIRYLPDLLNQLDSAGTDEAGKALLLLASDLDDTTRDEAISALKRLQPPGWPPPPRK